MNGFKFGMIDVEEDDVLKDRPCGNDIFVTRMRK